MSDAPPQYSLCVLLHNLLAGGSARQWLNLVGPLAAEGRKVTIVSPPGPLSEAAGEVGIELIEVDWQSLQTTDLDEEPWPRIAEHDVAVVHWDHLVMDAFRPALEACGRAALAIHQAPTALARWFGEAIVESTREPLELAVRHPAAVPLVRGEHHRRRFVDAFDLPADRFRVLPAAIPMPAAGPPAAARGEEVLALIRLSPDKAAVARLAIELVAAGLAAGDPSRLTIAGDGPWREVAAELCADALPAGSWRIEPAPADALARLAAADIVVAQGLTTLEAAALGKPTVVAREAGDAGVAGVVLLPGNYDDAARDPFGFPAVSADIDALWRQVRAVEAAELIALRELVARHNSIEACRAALDEALAATAPGLPAWRLDVGPL
jgi:hypothetical protein